MSFEKLRVYQAAQLLDAEVKALLGKLPKGHAKDVDHVTRAVGSILYNIPEAQGSISVGRKRYHLEVARGSSDESRAVLQRLVNNGAQSEKAIRRACALTSAIAKMLKRMIEGLPDR